MTEDLIPHALYKVDLQFPEPLSGIVAEQVGAALEDLAVSVFLHNHESADGDKWTVTLTTYGTPDAAAIEQALQRLTTEQNLGLAVCADMINVEKLPEMDWLQHVHDNFPPVTLGRFFIYGSHFNGEKPAGLIPLCIDAATAFGSGEHETTKGCMLAFDKIAPDFDVQNALDMGCGSGILAIAIAKIWPAAKITAIDIDPESIIVTERHANMNTAGAQITAQAGDGYAAPLAKENGPYDLIAANILAGPLVDMAPDLARGLKPGGYCVLSGLLGRQENDVTEAHTTAGLISVDSIALGEWRALVLQKPLS